LYQESPFPRHLGMANDPVCAKMDAFAKGKYIADGESGKMIEIDGSWGEGGGQILRSALTLAVLTGKAVRIDDIRAGRRKPGLMAQHLQAVRAAAAVSGARVEGARQGSGALVFEAAGVKAGEYRFDIGTAGSVALVLQTVLLPLAAGGGFSRVTVTGGTHVPWSPSYHYLSRIWFPCLRRLGMKAEISMSRAGFYPRGGGLVSAAVRPALPKAPLRLTDPGRLLSVRILSAVANLDESIAERQSRQALSRLEGCGAPLQVEHLSMPAPGPGTMLMVQGEFEHSRCGYAALGERGKPAERVADEAVDRFLAFLASGAAVDEHLADQMLIPLALAPGTSELRSARVTRHLLTNAWIIGQFLPAKIEIEGGVGEVGLVRGEGRAVRGER
jgi:RNA 3'-terminal phosphate cyclase (ATP)